jgi:hypothetical protein
MLEEVLPKAEMKRRTGLAYNTVKKYLRRIEEQSTVDRWGCSFSTRTPLRMLIIQLTGPDPEYPIYVNLGGVSSWNSVISW